MQIPRFAVALVFALISMGSAKAQMRAFGCVGSKAPIQNGDDLLGKVQRVYEQVQSFRSSFEQDSYLAALDQSESSGGQVLFTKPGRMKWIYAAPKEQVFIVKDKSMWWYQKDANQVVIDKVEDVLISDLPLAWMMGVGNLSKDFGLEKACEGPEGIVLSLKPKTSKNRGDGELAGFQLLIDPSSSLVRGAKVTHVGGNVTAIVLKDFAMNPKSPAVADTDFATKFPSDADISDHRIASR